VPARQLCGNYPEVERDGQEAAAAVQGLGCRARFAAEPPPRTERLRCHAAANVGSCGFAPAAFPPPVQRAERPRLDVDAVRASAATPR
jgi:hypothetical protein